MFIFGNKQRYIHACAEFVRYHHKAMLNLYFDKYLKDHPKFAYIRQHS